ncbi:6-phosphogluconolactonase [Paenibacillus sp. 1P07SE]|uniref:6-phosphogluconolactonase n=1 Tax=Paenibacillus sp. 1P07SE TaxID=3132209 RepID=UPI0039A6A5D8
MQIHIHDNADQLGARAADTAERTLQEIIAEQGYARIALSTGASQFPFFSSFVKRDLPWDKIEMFHLDEYIGLPASHPASFRKYLKERFLDQVPQLQKYWLVDGEQDPQAMISWLNDEISTKPVDLAMIGIGENGHIAFNDPPANFDHPDPYAIVDLDEACKQQQVNEGWFATLDDVPSQAISMTVQQILRSRRIISCVPHAAKAAAVRSTLAQTIDPKFPSTILKTHADWQLHLDKASSAGIFAWT